MTSAIQPRPRPTSDTELGFTQRKAVRWFSPPTLARAAAKVVLSAAFGDHLDKREMQSTLKSRVLSAGAGADDVWIDFIADTADGFNQTYSVASCASQREIAPIGLDHTLPRAQLIVFGGDEVYPYATPKEYEDRFSGPYLAALPLTEPDSSRPEEKHPRMLAIPGNHDWYDGLSGFMRLFAQTTWIGGRELEQTRSYFAADLPGPFWLWGIDIQSDNYVDALQIDYFKAAATQMTPDDALILCTAKPSWTDVRDAKDAYRNLAFVERTMVPRGVRTILMLSGDKHHYARYEAAKDVGPEGPRMRVTAGGGAFLSTTQKRLAIIFAVAAILSAFYLVPKRVSVWRSRICRGLAGVTQTAAHVAAQAAIAMVCVQAFQTETLTGWRLLLCTLLVGLAGGVVGSLIFAVFLFLVFTLFGWNSTEAFSSFRYSGYENFLRIHVTKEAVTVYPIGIDEVCKKWDYDAENTLPEAAWLKPSSGSIETRLIEPEFRILAPSAAATQRATAESRAVP